MDKSLLNQVTSGNVLAAFPLSCICFSSQTLSQVLQSCLGARRQCHPPYRVSLWLSRVVGLHPIERRVNQIQKLETKLNSRDCQLPPVALCHLLDAGKGEPWVRVEELPSCEDIQKSEGIFISESLQPVRAASEKYEIAAWLLSGVTLNSIGRNFSVGKRFPIYESRRQLTPRICELLGKTARKLCSRPTVRRLSRGPLPLLNVFRLHPLGYDSSFSSVALLVRSLQCHPHGHERRDRGEPCPYCGDSSPVEIASNAPLETRRQVFEFAQLQFPLWSGRHSAMQRDTGCGCATLATVKPPRDLRTRLREDV